MVEGTKLVCGMTLIHAIHCNHGNQSVTFKSRKVSFRTILLIINIKFRKFVWNQGVTNIYYYDNYDYYSQKTINAKITSAMLCVQQESSCYFGHCTQMNLMSFS